MKIFKSLSIISFLLLLTVSCGKDFLNRPPEDNLVVDNFYKTDEHVRASTGALYGPVWHDFNDKPMWAIGELASGNGRSWSDDVTAWGSLSVNNTDDQLRRTWAACYTAIAQANLILKNLNKTGPNITPAVLNQAKGEARFWRGLAFFYLVRIFGPVPLLEDNQAHLDDPLLPRAPREDVFKFIIRDLKEAENLLNASVRTSNYGSNLRLSKGSAKALMAKVYLYTMDYTNARAKAEEVINSGEFKLFGIGGADGLPSLTYADLFKQQTNFNEETIVSFHWKINGSAWGVANSVQGYFGYSNTVTQCGDGWAVVGPTIDLQRAYEPTDKRRKSTIMLRGDVYTELNVDGGGYTFPADAGAQGTNAAIKKYVVGGPKENPGSQNQSQRTEIQTYVMRYADVLLIHAESILGNNASTSDPQALESFNKIRRRAGLLERSSITLDDILKERRIEFAFESDYFYDLTRIDRAKALSIIANQERGTYNNAVNPPQVWSEMLTGITADRLVFDYPSSEVIQNPRLREDPVPYQF
jgi:starch-binding outer membrane protein, SusD/RagB family